MQEEDLTTSVNRTLDVLEIVGSPGRFWALRHVAFFHDKRRVAFGVETLYVLEVLSVNPSGRWLPQTERRSDTRHSPAAFHTRPPRFSSRKMGKPWPCLRPSFFDTRPHFFVVVAVGVGVLAARAFVCRASRVLSPHHRQAGQHIHSISKAEKIFVSGIKQKNQDDWVRVSVSVQHEGARLRARQAEEQQRTTATCCIGVGPGPAVASQVSTTEVYLK